MKKKELRQTAEWQNKKTDIRKLEKKFRNILILTLVVMAAMTAMGHYLMKRYTTTIMNVYATQQDNYVTVVLDTNLTPELIEEGFVREIVSKIQTMRKEADFRVTDKIVVYVANNEKIADIITGNADSIKADTLAEAIELGSMSGFTKEWNLNGEKVTMGVAQVSAL